jgi:MFS family permease
VIIGIASIIGPFVSSFFIASGPTFIFLSLAILFAASALLIDFYFEHEEVSLGKIKKKDFHPLLFLKNFGEKREVIIIFLIWFVIGLAMSGTNSVFSWYLQDNLSLSQQAILYIFTGAGILTVISQGLGLKHFWLRFWSEKKLALSAPVALTIGFLIMALPFFAWFIVGYIIEQLGRPIFRIIITSDIAEEANRDQRGSALGALSSVGAIAMIFGPLFFGLLFNIKPALVFVTSAGLAFITLILTILLLHRKLTSIDR